MESIKKIIKKVGNSVGITFNKEEQEVYGFKEEKIVEVITPKKKG